MNSDSQQFDNQVLQACIKSEQHDKDVDDLIEEVNNLSDQLKAFKEEILEDLCNVVGLNIDKYVMDKYEESQAKEKAKDEDNKNSQVNALSSASALVKGFICAFHFFSALFTLIKTHFHSGSHAAPAAWCSL